MPQIVIGYDVSCHHPDDQAEYREIITGLGPEIAALTSSKLSRPNAPIIASPRAVRIYELQPLSRVDCRLYDVTVSIRQPWSAQLDHRLDDCVSVLAVCIHILIPSSLSLSVRLRLTAANVVVRNVEAAWPS